MQLKRYTLHSLVRSAMARHLLAGAVLGATAGVLSAGDALSSDHAAGGPTVGQKNLATGPTATVEVRLEDESVLKVMLKDDRLEMTTRFGRLSIPVGDIEKIDFGHRVAHDVAASVTSHIAALGAKDFQSREAASQALLKLREKAYRELAKAAKSKDAEVVRRAEQLLQKIREQVPEDRLSPPEYDVVQTTDGSRLVGRIDVPAFRIRTVAFGDQQLKLSDVRTLRSLTYEEPEEVVADVLPDPGNMTAFQGQTGKTLAIRVTGRAASGPGRRSCARGGRHHLGHRDLHTRFDAGSRRRPRRSPQSRPNGHPQGEDARSANRFPRLRTQWGPEHGLRVLQRRLFLREESPTNHEGRDVGSGRPRSRAKRAIDEITRCAFRAVVVGHRSYYPRHLTDTLRRLNV